MEHTKVNCLSCNKELHIKVANGDNPPERVMCKACSQGSQQTKRVNLSQAQEHNFRAVDRAIKKRHNWTNTGKQKPTTREISERNRIYGSD